MIGSIITTLADEGKLSLISQHYSSTFRVGISELAAMSPFIANLQRALESGENVHIIRKQGTTRVAGYNSR